MLHRYPCLLAALILLVGVSASAQPVINSFYPSSGPAGSTITITGSGFNTTPAANNVFFGAVRGAVTGGTATSLTVNVPSGITYEPLSVYDFSTKLTGFAGKPFVMTFNGSSSFGPASYPTRRDFSAGSNVYGIAVGDIDADQKPDIVAVNGSSLSFSALRNISSTADIKFSPHVEFPAASTGALTGIALADLDGDGKKDVVVVNQQNNMFSAFRNGTTGNGNIVFESRSNYPAGDKPYAIAAADFDLDGKIDIAVTNQASHSISIFKNISTGVTINFAPSVVFPTNDEVRGIAVRDLNDDSKPDIVVVGPKGVSIFRNTGFGSIIFATRTDIPGGNALESVVIGDLDGDDKPEIVAANNDTQNGQVMILHNAGNTALISFVGRSGVRMSDKPFGMAIADLTGDGRLDVGVTDESSNSISLLSNGSALGNVGLNVPVSFPVNQQPKSIAFGDFDLDGRLDIAVGNNGSNLISVFLNNISNCSATAAISGPLCVGSVLRVSSNSSINSVSWLLNGNVAAVHKAGLQTTGTVVAGGNGGGAALNQFASPNRLFVDKNGVMYIPDMDNNRVMKWLPGVTSGVIVAGGNGAGSNANQLSRPTSVTVDVMGNIYVADQNNNRVQKWEPGATSGTTVASSLNAPTSLFIDAQNNLYVSDQLNHRILKFLPGSATGLVVAGGNGEGTATHQLNRPRGIFVDSSGNLFVCDTDNSRIQKWTPGATSGITVAKGPTLALPVGIYVDLDGNMYITDFNNGNVQKWTQGAGSGTIIIDGSSNMGAISPQAVWIDPNNSLYITDFAKHRVLKFENIFTGTYTVSTPGTYSAQVATSAGCAVTTNSLAVEENPTADVKISSSSSIICAAATPIFTVSTSSTGPAPLFQWKINGTNSGTPSASPTFSPAGLKVGDKVSCEASLTNGCGHSYQASSNIIIMTDVPQVAPAVSITASSTTFCAGTEVTFTAGATNAGSSPSFQWMLNGKPVTGATSATYLSKLLVNGDKISCEVLSNEQCQVNAKALSSEVAVKVNPVVVPEILITTSVPVIYENSSVTFTALLKNEGSSPGLDWQVNGQTVAKNKPTFTTKDLAEGDEVTCILTSNATCASTSAVSSNTIHVTITAVVAIKPSSAFTPNADAVNDTWEIPGISSFPGNRVEVFNQYGAKVFSSEGYPTPWNGEYNGTALPVGVYYYLVRLDDKTRLAGSVTILR